MNDFYGNNIDILKDKTLWLLDMDGTIYEDNDVFPCTLPFLQALKENGARYVFLTNNSSKSVEDYIAKVNRMGIEADRNNFFTSTQATVEYLDENYPGALVYAQGTRSFVKELRDSGIRVTEEDEEGIDVCLVGYDTELTYQKLTTTCHVLKRDVAYIAANLDFVCPEVGGFLPDCGSMCIGIRYATGKSPKVMGKPEPTMIYTACRRFKTDKSKAVLVGDRLYTDIASGNNAGITTICVLSGEATEEDLKTTEFTPSFVLKDVGEVTKLLKG